ncbi:MAG: CHAT domain-containing protein [Cyanobacteria bacterium J06638_6]
MQKILILAANPKTTSRLRLDEELRDIEEGLKRSQQRDQFSLTQRLAARPRDVQRAMLDEAPQIVHFSGHGEGDEGLVFENESGQAHLVSGAALADLFKLFADPASNPDPVHCVVLNGCYSAVQAEAIAAHVPYVIGMTRAIGDRAAIEFAVGFYDALGAGRPVEFAYKLGCTAISMAGKPESATPILINKKAPSPPPSSPSPSPPSPAGNIPQGRSELYQLLLSLPGPQFEQVLFDLNPPPGNISPPSAPQGQRVPELFTWLESPLGPATKLEALRAALARVLPPR